MKEWSIQTCPRSVHPDWSLMSGPSRVETMPCPWCALDAPAPYTEPRDGDEVEVTVRLRLERGASVEWAGRYVDVEPHGYGRMRSCVFTKALAEGRVRLVKAAAPQFEAGRIYRDAEGDTFAYLPTVAPNKDWPLLDINEGTWWSPNGFDLAPCDVVPREAT